MRIAAAVTLGFACGCGGLVVLEEERSSPTGASSGSAGASVGSSSSTSGGLGGGGEGAGGGGECWTRILSGSSSNWLRSQAVAADGSVVVTIDNLGDVTLDGTPLDLGDGGYVLVKLDSHGNLAWARRFGGSTQLPTLPVAFDSEGNILMGGPFYDEIDLGGGVAASTAGAGGFLAKWSPSGDPLWIQAWSVPIESGALASLALDNDDNVFFHGATALDDVMQWGPLVATGDTFVGKISAAGVPLWLRSFDGVLTERHGLATTPEGHVVIASSLVGDGSFDSTELSTPGDFDALLLELDGVGDVVNARQFGDDALQRTDALVTGASGVRAMFGVTWGLVDFGSSPLNARGENLTFVAAFDASGQNTWTKLAPNAYTSQAVSTDGFDGLAFVGDGAAAEAFGCQGQALDGFVLARFDGRGACTSQESVARCSDDPYCSIYFGGVAVTGDRTVVSGYFSGSAQLGDDLYSAAIWDGFILSRSQCGAP